MRTILMLCSALLLAPGARADSRAAPPSFDARYARMERAEALFLEDLFAITRGMAQENRLAASWLLSGGAKGLPLEDYLEQAAALLEDLERLETPPRIRELPERVAEAFRSQGGFLADWAAALAESRPFESQLTSEFGYHEGLHRSQRVLFQAYERTLALFPDEDETTRRALQAELRALDLLWRGH
jgi:hypothetical protein